AQLDRGARLVELLKQPQGSPFPVEKQVVSVWSGTSGELDDVPVADIRRFENEFLEYVERNHGGLLTSIVETGKLSDDGMTTLKDAITEFKKGFQTSEGKLLGEDEPVEPIAEDAVGQETITRVKKD
ncbi:F0F1 ATP synthase subunit alpha, partial [Actinomadura adrarensis]